MVSSSCELAIEAALYFGNALLKFISPNDAGLTGSHQCGFYLPKPVWRLYSPHPPIDGRNDEHEVRIVWQDGLLTESRVKWYGRAKSEYRLTRFGRNFPWLTADSVGNLLVLIPRTLDEFSAYVLDLEEDIAEVQSALGVAPFERWGVFLDGVGQVETEDECIRREFAEFAALLNDFPSGATFSDSTIRILEACSRGFRRLSPDAALVKSVETEYRLFRFVERQICGPEVSRLFRDVDDFLRTAARIMNRRKSRAGRSFENHVHQALAQARIPHEMNPMGVDGRPDIVIPNGAAYRDPAYPTPRLLVIGVKTTCKDRWRQVLNEGKRVDIKHLVTMQPGISTAQLSAMRRAKVTLVVPSSLHRHYPTDRGGIAMLNVAQLIDFARERLRS